MKAKITISFNVDTEDYHGTPPTIEGAQELVKAMTRGDADFPFIKDMKINVEKIPR